MLSRKLDSKQFIFLILVAVNILLMAFYTYDAFSIWVGWNSLIFIIAIFYSIRIKRKLASIVILLLTPMTTSLLNYAFGIGFF